MTQQNERTLAQELEASQRTITVLKERVVVMQSGSRSAIQRQLEAARVREDDSRRRRALMEMRTQELARHSATLEAEVAARTLAMRRILDNVTFGFLVADVDLIVQPECTESCARLLDAPAVVGAALTDLLRLEGGAASTYRACALQAFEDIMPEELSLTQMRATFRIGERTIKAEPRVVRTGAGPVQGLLYTISDISDLLAAQRESARNRMLIAILRNWDSFVAFVEDARALLARAEVELARRDDAAVRREIHTIKGNAAAYDLTEIVDELHRIEGGPIGAEALGRARQALDSFLHDHQDVLGSNLADDRQTTFAVTEAQLAVVRRIATEVASPALHGWVAGVAERPARVMLGPIEAFAARLAVRLGKEVELAIAGGEVPLADAEMRPVMQTMVHLVRNAIDHGIEAPEDRGQKGAAGKIQVTVTRDADAYSVVVTDDGAGIDVERVAGRALEQGAVTEAQLHAMSTDERRRLIFQDGISTAQTISNVSGRGVGMSAVLSAAQAARGRVEVESEAGRGTTFRIVIPRAKDVQVVVPIRRSGPPRAAAAR